METTETNTSKKEKEVPIWHKYALTLEEAALWTGIGINKLRELSSIPRCPFVVSVGKKRLLKRKALAKYLEGKIAV